jgi:hypothetical protein
MIKNSFSSWCGHFGILSHSGLCSFKTVLSLLLQIVQKEAFSAIMAVLGFAF